VTYARALTDLIDELSTRSHEFRVRSPPTPDSQSSPTPQNPTPQRSSHSSASPKGIGHQETPAAA
jgi:hypothetical protein